MINRNNTLLGILFSFIAGIFFVPFISSCGKGGAASNVGLNTQLEILNLSPNVHPVNLYVGYLIQNSSALYSYPYPSGYFYLNSIDTPIQIRSSLSTTVNLISVGTPLLSNHKYSLFITGLTTGDSTVTSILTLDDTVTIPKVGFGKIRFINASVLSPPIDVIANGTSAFPDTKYLQVTPYIQLPAGNYAFQMNPTGSPGTILTTNLAQTTIQDGRLYTLYTYGVVGRVDSAAFGAGVLTNR